MANNPARLIEGIPFKTAVQAGLVPGWSIVVINGHNEAQAQTKGILAPGNEGAIINPNAILATPAAVNIASTDDTKDDATGVGANSVLVTGLDANGDVQTEAVTMHATSGQTAVATNATWSAINNLTVATVGSELDNSGTIWCGTGTFTSGVPAVGLHSIQPGENFSNTGTYTVPAGHQLIPVNGAASADGTAAWKGAEFDVHVYSAALAKELGLFSIHLGDGAALAAPDILIAPLDAGMQMRLISDILAQSASASFRVDGYLRNILTTTASTVRHIN